MVKMLNMPFKHGPAQGFFQVKGNLVIILIVTDTYK